MILEFAYLQLERAPNYHHRRFATQNNQVMAPSSMIDGPVVGALMPLFLGLTSVHANPISDHLFLLCDWSWTRVWNVLFCVVAWTSWEVWNGVVFQGMDANVSKALESIKFRVVWRFKNFGCGSGEDTTLLLLDVEGRCIDKKIASASRLCSWSLPPDSDLSSNMDGASRGNPDMAGVGGVLREAGRKVLCLFSSFIGIADPILAEVSAIHKACFLIASSQALDDRLITIWSDSSLVVSWINGHDFDKLSLIQLIYGIRQFLSSRILISIKFMPRGFNSLADCLARVGADTQGERLEWSI
ncbi:hypothetical protein QYF36_000697 [Acer negundo]|nr:hypothetical protein QYF36_000697 [Acer negundo]